MDFSRLTDEELMVMYQNGNEQAFQVLYQRHSGRILAYIRSRVSNAELVGDIFQETFVKIHKSKKLYNKTFQVLPWVFTITHNAMIDALRKQKTRPLETDQELDEIAAPTVEEVLTLQDLSPALAKLPQGQREALQLRYGDEKSFEEIAARLNTSSENARKLISRGLQSLKKMFHQEDR